MWLSSVILVWATSTCTITTFARGISAEYCDPQSLVYSDHLSKIYSWAQAYLVGEVHLALLQLILRLKVNILLFLCILQVYSDRPGLICLIKLLGYNYFRRNVWGTRMMKRIVGCRHQLGWTVSNNPSFCIYILFLVDCVVIESFHFSGDMWCVRYVCWCWLIVDMYEL